MSITFRSEREKNFYFYAQNSTDLRKSVQENMINNIFKKDIINLSTKIIKKMIQLGWIGKTKKNTTKRGSEITRNLCFCNEKK